MRIEACRHGDAVRAIAVKPARRRAVELRVLPVEKRYRHLLAVMRWCEYPPGRVQRWIVPGGYFLVLAQNPLAAAHVVVEHLYRRRHRRIAEPHELGVVFERPAHAERIGLFVERDRMFVARAHVANDDARQPILALEANQMV